MNFSVAVGHLDTPERPYISTFPTTPQVLQRLADEQRRNYDSLSGLFVFGAWFRDWLVEHQGLPHERVHVVGAGMNHTTARDRPPTRQGRLLFVGGDFLRKGGDQVVAAVDLLRQRGEDVTLTVAGPSRWPLPGSPPSWVRFAGYVSPEHAEDLWLDHDLLVVPSRFEAYGMVFSEALAAGRPCIGRRVFAMPELIGDAGRLIERGDGAEELAGAVLDALSDDTLFERVWRDREDVRRERSWDAVAARIVAVVERNLQEPAIG
jgi:glycosyltransferase involved in cell wall biosynthesis